MVKFVIAGVGIIFAMGLFFSYTKNSYANVSIIKAQIAQYEEALQKAAQLDELKKKLIERRNSFSKADLDRLHLMLPDHPENIGLILEIDSLASHYGMALENADVTTNAGGGASEQTVGGVIGTAPSFADISIHFSTYGTYDHFKSFMRDLETSLRVVDLVSLSIQPDGTIPGSYHYDITIKTYWLK